MPGSTRCCRMPVAPKTRRRRRFPGGLAASAASMASQTIFAPKTLRASSTPPIRSRRRSAPTRSLPVPWPPCRCWRSSARPGSAHPAIAGSRSMISLLRRKHSARRRVFLGIGRVHLKMFAAHSQHVYLVRLVDPPRAPLPLPDAEVIVARGPFDRAGDRAMLTNFRADIVVTRNAGGYSASAKIEAARDLALPVVMVRRPSIPARAKVETVAEVLRWLGHDKTPAERGL